MKKIIHIIGYICFSLSLFCVAIFLYKETSIHHLYSTEQKENHIAFVLDVSQSMKVQDMDNTSRLLASKQKIFDIISENTNYNFALSIFAGESQRVLPFTQDIGLFSTFLKDIDNNNLTVQGTNINSALSDTLENFGNISSGHIVLITDGSDDTIKVDSTTLGGLRKKNMSISILGVGSIDGGTIPSGNINSPYKLYDEQIVIPKLNTAELQKLSENIGGRYYDFHEKIVFSHGDINKDSFINMYFYLIIAAALWGMYLSSIWHVLYYEKK